MVLWIRPWRMTLPSHFPYCITLTIELLSWLSTVARVAQDKRGGRRKRRGMTLSDPEQSLRPALRSRIKKWLQRVFKSGALGTELARLINKSALVGAVRWIIDMFFHR